MYNYLAMDPEEGCPEARKLLKQRYLFIYFILFATLITKNIGKEEEKKKKEVARRPNRNYRSYKITTA